MMSRKRVIGNNQNVEDRLFYVEMVVYTNSYWHLLMKTGNNTFWRVTENKRDVFKEIFYKEIVRFGKILSHQSFPHYFS